jgi:hypothetical protein
MIKGFIAGLIVGALAVWILAPKLPLYSSFGLPPQW